MPENDKPGSPLAPGEPSGSASGVPSDPNQPIVLVPHHQDPIEALARSILDRHGTRLPDLTDVTVLLPEPGLAARLREQLLDLQNAPAGALLGPRIAPLRSWALGYAEGAVPDEQRRNLMLFEALREHPGLFQGASPWHLVEELIALFDELSLQRVQIPDDGDAFNALVGRAYGLTDAAPPALDREAALVHLLWQAWHQQHADEGLQELQAEYLNGLARGLAALGEDEHVYVLGLEHASRGEIAWAGRLIEGGKGTIVVHATLPVSPPTDAETPGARLLEGLGANTRPAQASACRAELLEELYDRSDLDLAARARRCSRRLPRSPMQDAVRVAIADDLDQEAELIDIQIRLWLGRGKRRIGIVTEDRRLARRLRALLERSGISVADGGGWALSTTSAAAALERWLECVEEDFAHQALLDVLKSPYMFAADERESRLRTVYRLEQDVVHHENIARGLGRYRAAVLRRRDRLEAYRSGYAERLLGLLDELERAAAPLVALRHGSPRPAGDYLAGLRESLSQLGLSTGLTEDDAGQAIFDVIERMEAAAGAARLRLRWAEFRAWLGRNLERHYFHPPSSEGPIVLTDLPHSRLQRFDALLLARLDERHFPGPGTSGAFFNDAVRGQLGLTTWHQRLTARLVDFRRLLEAADEVVLTTARGDSEEELRPSPWLELLGVFHRIGYGSDLHDRDLRRLCGRPDVRPFEGDTLDRPPIPPRPAPQIPPALIPSELSVSAHQSLVDCPYRFYARYCLGLQPPEEISEALSKADFGMLVHRCLQALHSDVRGLPGPLPGPIGAEQRDEAITLLERISTEVFEAALEDSFEHRGWLQRWRAAIASYVDWEIAHGRGDGEVATEQNLVRELEPGLVLRGRLDRLEHVPEGLRIIDYKTGESAARADVLCGSDVQIASYAILAPEARRIEYLKIEPRSVTSGAVVGDEELCGLRDKVAHRLRDVYARLRAGEGAIANGDDAICRYCDMAGLCRRATWSTLAPDTTDSVSDGAITQETTHE